MIKYFTELEIAWPYVKDLLTMSISIITLMLAFEIKQKFAVTELHKKQVEHVCNLIEKLNSSVIEIGFWSIDINGGSGGFGFSVMYNIFEIAGYDKWVDDDDSSTNHEYDDEPVYFESSCNQLLDIYDWINHPLTPVEIADQLELFYNKRSSVQKREGLTEEIKYINVVTRIMDKRSAIFNESDTLRGGDLLIPDALALKNWENFKAHAKSLNKLIVDWLGKKGIKNPNLRIDYKVTSDELSKYK